jgi:hypothetical protein
VVVPGHPFTEAQVVEEGDRFLVIEKVGEAGAIAADLDPRGGGR